MSPTNQDEQQIIDPNKPPLQKKRTRRLIRGGGGARNQPGVASSSAILAGVEDDVVDWVDEIDERDEEMENPDLASDRKLPPSQSIPTDKFYLETEKKFAIQNKNLFEKKQEERMKQMYEAEQKRQLKEELKFQISAPRTALKTHKFLRALFLLIEGVSVGFLIWQAVMVHTVNVGSFLLNLNSTSIPDQLPYVYIFRDLTMPIHCLSYFFLTICIIDCLDRYLESGLIFNLIYKV